MGLYASLTVDYFLLLKSHRDTGKALVLLFRPPRCQSKRQGSVQHSTAPHLQREFWEQQPSPSLNPYGAEEFFRVLVAHPRITVWCNLKGAHFSFHLSDVKNWVSRATFMRLLLSCCHLPLELEMAPWGASSDSYFCALLAAISTTCVVPHI